MKSVIKPFISFFLITCGLILLYSWVFGPIEGFNDMKIFIKLFIIAIIALGLTMLYSTIMTPIEVLEEARTKVKSKYSEKIVSAPMRRVKQGFREFWQVKVPGGGWYECRNSDCPETLRVEHVDHAFTRLQESEPGTISPYNEER
ncbi:MAG: hypothetical protein L3J67_01140 [Hyphomicrobiaceae bacterium]|nr:hypothetical protein [Hyphomicrobiaceae bacterium]